MHRYCLVEYERRFLLEAMPASQPVTVRSIVDRYIDGTRLRLRQTEETVDGRIKLVYKLTQKIPFADVTAGHQGELTTIYLEAAEYEVFAALPAAVLIKTRHIFPPMGVDVFEGPLAGLITAEAEFDTPEELAAFVPPPWCTVEISADPVYTGGHLSRLKHPPSSRTIKL